MTVRWLALASVLFAGAAQAHDDAEGDPRTVSFFETMFGVDGIFLEGQRTVRGIPGDELPWDVGQVRGRLWEDGRLRLRVQGLVHPDDPSVPDELRGVNDEPYFRAIVSCLSENPRGGVNMINVATPRFEASSAGDADVDAILDLPDQCIAPLVFVMAGEDRVWLAMNGIELGE